MGIDSARDPGALDRECPQHELHLPTYYIARYPVTVAQFRAFVQDSGFRPGHPDCLRDPDNHPVRYVNWHEARAYCAWLTETLRAWEDLPAALAARVRDQGWVVRLPSEAEWEKAARGSDGRKYPWGRQEPTPEHANYGRKLRGTVPVGPNDLGASAFGLHGMAGNVWEWVEDDWHSSYDYAPDDGRAWNDDPRGPDRVVRGGGWLSGAHGCRSASRGLYAPDYRLNVLGFRLARSLILGP